MFSGLGYTELLLIGVIALMLFGSRLPEVARNFGGTYRDLRRKVDDFQQEFRNWDRAEPSSTAKPKLEHKETDRVEPAAPKFVPPPADDDDD